MAAGVPARMAGSPLKSVSRDFRELEVAERAVLLLSNESGRRQDAVHTNGNTNLSVVGEVGELATVRIDVGDELSEIGVHQTISKKVMFFVTP